MSQPYGKYSDYIVRQQDPFNGGPRLHDLVTSEITPNDRFFALNHGNVPVVNAGDYRLAVEGQVAHPLSLTLDELKQRFATTEQVVTLQCAGNRRLEMMALHPIPGELGWGAEAISNARWKGVRLQEVLAAAQPEVSPRLHVEFIGLDEAERHEQRFNFGGSIPLERALSSDVLLAYEMNGASLPPLHGFPLRVVIPGYIGARSVKWLKQIIVRPDPSQNYFQRKAYRLFSPDIRLETVNWDAGLMLGEMSLTSVICAPSNGKTKAGSVEVSGYAMAGGQRSIARVEVSADGGHTWTQAELQSTPQPGVWTLWRAQLALKPGIYELTVRAVDSAANVQPARVEQIWNFKGYMNNAWNTQTLEVN